MKKYIAKRAATMFGVLLITLLITIMLVGSNMDTILKQGVVFQVRSEITENPEIAQSFSSVQEFEGYIQDRTDERIKNLGLDEPWYSPQRIGLTMYKIKTSDICIIILNKITTVSQRLLFYLQDRIFQKMRLIVT